MLVERMRMAKKIVRTVCYFTKKPNEFLVEKLNEIERKLIKAGYEIQTKRICTKGLTCSELRNKIKDKNILLSIGSLNFKDIKNHFESFLKEKEVSFNLNLTNENIEKKHVDVLLRIIKESPVSTFCFAYTFNNKSSSPYFPSANYEREGFTIGLQATNLSEGCNSIDDWLNNIKICWDEINNLLKNYNYYLGIDSSIAPAFDKFGSLINFMRKIYFSFDNSVLAEDYINITNFIKSQNPKPIGLCGLMFPCLEDFELAEEYERGNFSIERNILLSLYSGLGIDTYPIGIDEDPKKILNILRLVQTLSKKYNKPLSVRFVSDGKATIGKKSRFNNEYLKDIVIRKL